MPNSPHLQASKTKAQFLVAIAENDDKRAPNEKNVLKDTFAKANLPAEIEVYAGAAHGWCPPDSRVYNEPQAEKAWSRLLALYGKAPRVIRRRTMQKTTIALVFGLAGLAAGSWLSTVSSAAGTSYGEDRAQIEDLQARYLFALDFHDPQLYASTFTPTASSTTARAT